MREQDALWDQFDKKRPQRWYFEEMEMRDLTKALPDQDEYP